MMSNSLPTLGAAMPIDQLETHTDWLKSQQRDLEIQDPFRPDVLDGNWKPLAQRAKQLLSGYTGRMGIHGPFDGLALMSIDPKVSQVAASRLLQALDFAEEIGATHMVVHSPFMAFGHAFVPTSPYYERSKMIERVHKTIENVLPRAEQIKCTLVIENIQDMHPTPWLELIRSFKSEYVRASIDVGHAFLMHRIGGASPDAFVREAGELLAHVHLQDTDGLSDRHWCPGNGNLNWYALFSALHALPHRPRLILELHDYAEIGTGAQYLAERKLAQ